MVECSNSVNYTECRGKYKLNGNMLYLIVLFVDSCTTLVLWSKVLECLNQNEYKMVKRFSKALPLQL